MNDILVPLRRVRFNGRSYFRIVGTNTLISADDLSDAGIELEELDETEVDEDGDEDEDEDYIPNDEEDEEIQEEDEDEGEVSEAEEMIEESIHPNDNQQFNRSVCRPIRKVEIAEEDKNSEELMKYSQFVQHPNNYHRTRNIFTYLEQKVDFIVILCYRINVFFE